MAGALPWVDGALRPEGTGLPLDDRGFTLGDGLFETLRVRARMPFRLERHLERLTAGAEVLGIPRPSGLRRGVTEVLEANRVESGSLRITLSRGSGAGGLAPSVWGEPRVVITVGPYARDPRWHETGVRVVIGGGRIAEGALTSGIKALGYAERIAALREASARGADDALLLNGRGDVAGGTASNVLALFGDRIVTPTRGCGALPGITREAVLEVAARSGIRFERGPLSTEVMGRAGELLLTSSLRGVVPVVSIDGAPVGTGRPGPLWRRLHLAYEEVVRSETQGSPG